MTTKTLDKPTKNTGLIHSNLSIGEKGRLLFAGHDTVELAKKYGTPLMLLDEHRIRSNCRYYHEHMRKHFGDRYKVLYAGKALCISQLYRVMAEENMHIDVVSVGEIYTAKNAGFPLERAFFHGSNKTVDEINFAVENKIGYFITDNISELERIDAAAGARGAKQKILLRLTPGIDPHTHEAVKTGLVDSKFGIAIETGQAESAIKFALTKKNIELCGFHSHIGSQIFESGPFCDAAKIMIDFIADIKERLNYTAQVLNLGGGFGVRYTEEQPETAHCEIIKDIYETLNKNCKQRGISCPEILIEPGRSIVADAGLTLYTVGNVKEITGYKNYAAIDGGMTDNPRYALYQSPYTVLIANKMDKNADYTCTIAGRCCESGDLIQENVTIPKPLDGDILAVLVTGAYNYSMASNYNKVARPPVVMLRKDEDCLIVRRESLDDLIKNDILV